MKKKVYAYLHTHWDREWYRDKEDFNLRLLDVIDIVLDELKNDKAPFFYLDGQVIALIDYLKYRPYKKEEIINLIKHNKLAIGPYFVCADSYLVNFCSMLKNLELGLKFSKEFYQKDFIGNMCDIFGISKSAFLALGLKNIDKALIWRGVNPDEIKNECDFLYGNKIKTTWLAQGYFNDFFHSKTPNVEGVKRYLDKISSVSKDSILMPIGADHLCMLTNASKIIESVNRELDDYEIILTSPFEYFKSSKFKNKIFDKEFLDNSNTYTLSGVYSTRIYQKIRNVQIQNRLSRIIEPLNFYLKDKFDKNIEEVWTTLLKNHAHDGIYGCSIDSVQKAVDSRFDKCELAINAIEKRIIGNFKKKNNIIGRTTDKIGLFNLSNNDNIKTITIELPYILDNSQVLSKRRGFCDDLLYDISKTPVTEDICDIYTQLVEVSSNKKFEFNTLDIIKPQKKVRISDKLIENEFISLKIKNNKVIISNYTNQFELKLSDIKDLGDSYNFAPSGGAKILELKKTKIIYQGCIACCLRLYYKDIELDVVLDNHAKFLKFNSKINNRKKNHKIQLCLLLKNPIDSTIAQDAIGIVERKTDPCYKMSDFMPCKRPVELKTNSYPMQNFVNVQDAVIFTKGLHEYEIYKNELRICLLRCTGTISNPKNKARSIPAGPDLKTPDAQCIGTLDAQFAIMFGDYKDAFTNLDLFLDNYIALDGEFRKKINLTLDKIPDNSYIYGMSENKKISYNISSNIISLI